METCKWHENILINVFLHFNSEEIIEEPGLQGSMPPTEYLAPSEQRPQPLDVSHGLQVAPPVSEEGIFEDPNTARNER